MVCYLVKDFGKLMFLPPLFSNPVWVWVHGASGILILRALQEENPWILGKTRMSLDSTGREAAGREG